MPDMYTGRLACDGDGNLLANDGRPVYHDPAVGYLYLGPGDPTHNARHHERFVTPEPTTQALYDENGVLVTDPEQPHHRTPAPNDPHATGLVFHNDTDGPTSTGCTEAYA